MAPSPLGSSRSERIVIQATTPPTTETAAETSMAVWKPVVIAEGS